MSTSTGESIITKNRRSLGAVIPILSSLAINSGALPYKLRKFGSPLVGGLLSFKKFSMKIIGLIIVRTKGNEKSIVGWILGDSSEPWTRKCHGRKA